MLHINARVKCLGVQSTLYKGSNSFLFWNEKLGHCVNEPFKHVYDLVSCTIQGIYFDMHCFPELSMGIFVTAKDDSNSTLDLIHINYEEKEKKSSLYMVI